METKFSPRQARSLTGMSQSEVAEKMGVSAQTITLWETGKVDISAKRFCKFCEVVDISRDDIILP